MAGGEVAHASGKVYPGKQTGFATQSVPLDLSEMAPSKYRGALNIIGFQLFITVGIFIAQILWGWRLTMSLLGDAVVPALIITVGSMIERGKHGGEAKQFNDLVAPSHAHPCKHLLQQQRKYRLPQRVMVIRTRRVTARVMMIKRVTKGTREMSVSWITKVAQETRVIKVIKIFWIVDGEEEHPHRRIDYPKKFNAKY